MAGSSYSSVSFTFLGSIAPEKHDVFLSFRGEDTRYSFISHLVAALTRSKIKTYIDNSDLQRGDEISDKLRTAIEGSKLAIVIFSKNYANSSWCLDELVKIIECKETNGQILLPIFYHIDPSVVRHQKGNYAKAFAKHKLRQAFSHYRKFPRYNYNKEKLNSWREALTKAANHSGLHTLEYRKEAELVEKIAEDVSLRLQIKEVEDMSLPVWKRSFEKTMRAIKQHANVTFELKFIKGQLPSVGINISCPCL